MKKLYLKSAEFKHGGENPNPCYLLTYSDWLTKGDSNIETVIIERWLIRNLDEQQGCIPITKEIEIKTI